MASRWSRIVPAVRNEVNRNASRGSALRPSTDGGLPNPFNFIANELRSMERDMNRMQSTFFNDHNRNSFFRPFSSFFNNDSSLFGNESGGGNRGTSGDIGDYIVEDKDGKKKLQLEFDASGFRPEDIQISTRSGNRLEIHAKYQDESEGHRVYQEHTKVMTLPEGVDAKQITCHFDNNSLTIEAPYTPPANSQQQKIGSSKSGPQKINVKHLGDEGDNSSSFLGGHSGGALGGNVGDEVEGGSQPMVGGNHDPNALNRNRWNTSSDSTGSSGIGGPQQSSTDHTQQQQDRGSERTAAAGRR